MPKFEHWYGYTKGEDADNETPRRLKIEGIANEVADLLIEKQLTCDEVEEVANAIRSFASQLEKQCRFTYPQSV